VLQRTFLHLQGVGETTERRMWAAGLRSWADFLAAPDHPRFGLHRPWVEESVARLTTEQWSWFDRQLPGVQKWRAWGELRDRALFVDIETDGGAYGDSLTVLGTYDGHVFRAFVAGENLDEAQAYLESFPLVVTFNGAQFDLPVIRQRFPRQTFNFVHVDLRFPLRRLGYAGGLKAIETARGLQRSPDTHGLGGWDAVRLWQEWRCGSREARELLLAYNREDVQNLRPLMEFVYQEGTRDWP
jgi:uncharacterized protein YprB with RNaseH-like and TPR domain